MNNQKHYELIKAQEMAKVDFAIMLNTILEEKNINRTMFSKRSGKSKSLISRIMGSDKNLTIETMVTLIRSLDEELVITTKKRLIKEHRIMEEYYTLAATKSQPYLNNDKKFNINRPILKELNIVYLGN